MENYENINFDRIWVYFTSLKQQRTKNDDVHSFSVEKLKTFLFNHSDSELFLVI